MKQYFRVFLGSGGKHVEVKPLDQKLEGEFIKSTKEISNHLDPVV